MRVLVALACLVASASAFVAPQRRTAPRTSISMITEGATPPLGMFDPLGLSKLGSDATNAWFRQAEIKHGRVAMAAFVGWCLTENGITFPGNVASDVSFASLAGKPLDAWGALPLAGKIQIITFLGIIEIASEMPKPHYMKGGKPGVVPYIWDPIGITSKMSEEVRTARPARLPQP